MSLLHTLPFALVLGVAAGAAFAQDVSTTVGESMASGRMSQAAAEQYVATSGYNVDGAQDKRINEIAFIKWGDD